MEVGERPTGLPGRVRRATLTADSGEANAADDGAAEVITLRVACLDGTTLVVTVAQRGLVRELKRLVAQVRGVLICRNSVNNY